MQYKDVALVNSSLNQLGDSLLQNRMLEMRQNENDASNTARGKQLDMEMERVNLAKTNAAATQQHYKTIEEQNAARGTTAMTAQQQRDKGAMLQTLIKLNAGGQISDLDKVNKWLEADPHFGPTGIQLKTPAAKPPPQVGQNSHAQALEQAQKYRDAAEAADDPDQATQLTHYAEMLEQLVERAANPPEKAAKPDRPIHVKSKGPNKEDVTQDYTPEEWAAKQGPGNDGNVRMIDKQDRPVLVPLARKAEMLGKGYKLAPGSQ